MNFGIDTKYTKYNYDQEFFNDYLKIFFKEELINEFITFLNNDNVFLSGSSILQIINKNVYNDTFKDLDIYIDITKFYDLNIKDLLFNLTTMLNKANYVSEKDFNILFLKSKKKQSFLKSYYTLREIRKLKKQTNNDKINDDDKKLEDDIFKNTNFENITLGSVLLSQNFLDYFKFVNINNTTKIEIIFINSHIKDFMDKTFDMSIIKNYYTKGEIYCKSVSNIFYKKSVINLHHFYNRILNNKHEFKNFMLRYTKYKNRGYNIYIGSIEVNDLLFNNIVNIFENYKLLFSYTFMKNNFNSVYDKNYYYSYDKLKLYLSDPIDLNNMLFHLKNSDGQKFYNKLSNELLLYKFKKNINNYEEFEKLHLKMIMRIKKLILCYIFLSYYVKKN